MQNIVMRKKLDARCRREVARVRERYRKLTRAIEDQCVHDFCDWYLTPNPAFRYNFMGEPVYLRRCKLCGKDESRVGT